MLGRSLSLWLFLAAVAAWESVPAQTLYTNDGQTVAREEATRWFANRARYAPDKEKARLGGSYTVPAGPIPPLAPYQRLITPARKHSEDMAKTGTFDHDSPVGTLYYTAGWTAGQRLTYEGYTWSTYGENIACGYADGREAHEGWFLSDGHRNSMLNSAFLELGVGYYYYGADPLYYYRYYTQDYGRRSGSTEHFFTGTIFFDSDGDKMYGEAEAVSGIEIYLKTQSVMHAWCDVSSTSGSFAVPIQSIRDSDAVEVVIRNNSGSARSLSIPIDFDRLARLDLTNLATFSYGTFTQPTNQQNVGFRNVLPHRHAIASVAPTGGSMSVSAGTLIGATYALQARESLTTGSWGTLSTTSAAATTTVFLDSTPATQRFYRVTFLKE